MKRANIVCSSRMAGKVKRYHTWPTIQAQTVAEHSWHVMRIFQALWPEEMTPDVWDYILWHDAAEIGTGDIPYPVKATHPELKAALEAIEAEVLDNLGVSMPHISEDLHKKIKMCELLEMAEFGADEMMMGNRYAQPILDDTLAALIVLARENDVWEQVTLYGRTVGLYNQEELQ